MVSLVPARQCIEKPLEQHGREVPAGYCIRLSKSKTVTLPLQLVDESKACGSKTMA